MRISKNFFCLVSYGLEDRAAKDGHINIFFIIIFVHIIMSGQEELEVFLFFPIVYVKSFFFVGQKELEVFLFHIVC